jgi:hypothetical protein
MPASIGQGKTINRFGSDGRRRRGGHECLEGLLVPASVARRAPHLARI